MTETRSVAVEGSVEGRAAEILTDDALAFIGELHGRFEDERRALLARRLERSRKLADGGTLDFLAETREIRDGDWTIEPEPDALAERKVEITGPTSAKMVINALNSGASGFMADFEDSNSPTWENVVGGQVNLADAVRERLEFTSEDGKDYALGDELATLLVRPRGWHLVERHLTVDGAPIAGGLVDFGLYAFHNSRELLDRGAGRTSTFRSSSRTSRRASGPTSSSTPRRGSVSTAAPSRRRS